MGRARKAFAWLIHERLDVVLFVAALSLTALTLSPTLGGAFYGDDARTSLNVARLFELQHTSVLEYALQTQMQWISTGRLFPLSAYAYFLMYAVNGDVLAYRLFLMGLTLANITLLSVLVVRITRSRALGLLAALLMPLVFQLRLSDDPMTTHLGLLQIVTGLTLLSLLALLSYLETGKGRYLAASLVAFGAGLLTYEVALPLFVTHLALCWVCRRRFPRRRAQIAAWAFVAVVLAAVLGTLALRLAVGAAINAGSSTSPYALNWDLPAIVGTFVKQTTAVFPLSYYVTQALRFRFGSTPPSTQPLHGIAGAFADSPVLASLIAVGFVVLVGVALVRASREPREPAAPLAPVVASGLCLLVLPGTLISLSSKYQSYRWVRWGVGYLPVYISSFGVALLVAAGLYALAVSPLGFKAKRMLLVVAVMAAAFVGVTNFGNSADVIGAWAKTYDWPRKLEQGALENGVMSGARDGRALMTMGRDFESPDLFLLYAGRRVGRVISAPGPSLLKDVAASVGTTSGATVYAFGPGHELDSLDVYPEPGGTGRAVFGAVASVTVDGQGRVADRELDPRAVYVSWDPGVDGAEPPPFPEGTGPAAPYWELSRSGIGWALYQRRALGSTGD